MNSYLDQKIGVLGGGQLGKMLAQAASPMGIQLYILDKDKNFPAGQVAPHFTEGNFNDYDDVMAFGADKDIITIEIEAVNTDALVELEKMGKKVYPQPSIVSLIKDKGTQKLFYRNHHLPTSPFDLYDQWEDIITDVENGTLIYPFVQKARSGGYDGRGVQVVKGPEDLKVLLQVPSLVEDLVDIDREISVIVARSSNGEISSFPVVDMEFHPTANLVEFLYSPSKSPIDFQNQATRIAEKLVSELEIVGLLAVELFLDANGQILINEVAPRPHNSGHHTIEANVTSQYQQHLRAITGLPLGSTRSNLAAVMVNVLGEDGYTGRAHYQNIEDCLKMEGVYIHLYGKEMTKPFRKMGHITIVSDSLDRAIEKAKIVKNTLKVIT
ncbi:MAG: 5-(carboxyamino)imidazole ribonucleotide synthase [Saprospiraceae bacterium]|nr:5-(carboxyamino)imidazole ribonucleotide synthase [Saprospiraceae bacterium]